MPTPKTPKTAAEMRQILASRKIERVVVLGANGTMGFGSAALFTTAVPEVTFLARTKEKAEEGLAAAIKQVRSPTVALRSKTGDYEHDLASAVAGADLIFIGGDIADLVLAWPKALAGVDSTLRN